MSNILTDIGHGIKVGAMDVAKAVEYPVTFLRHAEKVIAYVIREQPEIKAAVLTLIKQAETVIADVAKTGSAEGINLEDDAQALTDAEAFFHYFKATFIPLVEKIYTEITADVK